jgi:superfamily I DNA/RNA helicase
LGHSYALPSRTDAATACRAAASLSRRARNIAGGHRNICVVGDPDQSIYKFRGSDIRNILDFERDFPRATVLTLSENYRSTKSILSAADRLISHNTQRKPKPLISMKEGGSPVRFAASAQIQQGENRLRRGNGI